MIEDICEAIRGAAAREEDDVAAYACEAHLGGNAFKCYSKQHAYSAQ